MFCLYVSYHMNVLDPGSSEEGMGSYKTGVTDGCVLQVDAET